MPCQRRQALHLEGFMFLHVDRSKVFALSPGAAPGGILAHTGWIGNFEDRTATPALPSECCLALARRRPARVRRT